MSTPDDTSPPWSDDIDWDSCVIDDTPQAEAVESPVLEPEPSTSLTPRLPIQQDNFALAVVEYGGNLAAAYRSVFGANVALAGAKARELMLNPAIKARVDDLMASVHQQSLITIETHLIELAEIRDLSKQLGAVKVALGAEELRGKVAGFYAGKGEGAPGDKGPKHLEELGRRLMGMLPDRNTSEVVDVTSREIKHA